MSEKEKDQEICIIRNLLRTINIVFKGVLVAEENWTGSRFLSSAPRNSSSWKLLVWIIQMSAFKTSQEEKWKIKTQSSFTISCFFSDYHLLHLFFFIPSQNHKVNIVPSKIPICRNERRQRSYDAFWYLALSFQILLFSEMLHSLGQQTRNNTFLILLCAPTLFPS